MVKQVQIILWDDLDHYENGIETPADGTYLFGWGGQDWEIDLTEQHFKEMAEALRPWLECARPVKEEKRAAPSAAARRGAGTAYLNTDGSVNWAARKQRTKDLARVRAWAKNVKGMTLPARGNLSVALQQEWNAAHPGEEIQVIGSGRPVAE